MNKIDELKELTDLIRKEDEKQKSLRIPLLIFQLMLLIAGNVMLIVYSSWQVCLSVFLLMWANNMQFDRKVKKLL